MGATGCDTLNRSQAIDAGRPITGTLRGMRLAGASAPHGQRILPAGNLLQDTKYTCPNAGRAVHTVGRGISRMSIRRSVLSGATRLVDGTNA